MTVRRLVPVLVLIIAGLIGVDDAWRLSARAQDTAADCTEFASFEEANAYYAENPDAESALDDDGDGTACEVYFGLELRETEGDSAATSEEGTAVEAAQETDADLDCEDFETQEEAQAVFEEDESDPHNLDPNGDGIACALLPSAADTEATNGGGDESAQDGAGANQSREQRGQNRRQRDRQTEEVTCADFETQEEAQAAFDEDPEGLAHLDDDNDQIACEELLEEPSAGNQGRRGNRRNQGDREPTPPAETIDEPAPTRREDLDCIDFEFQEEAQRVYERDTSDPFNLDPNGDGFACSSLPSSRPVVSQVPKTGVGPAMSAPVSAALIAGILALGVAWRSRAQDRFSVNTSKR